MRKAMRVTADLAANDPLLDAIAFSRGRFVVSMPGMAALVVPAWPEAARADRGLPNLNLQNKSCVRDSPELMLCMASTQRKEVIRCLMVQQRGRYVSFTR